MNNWLKSLGVVLALSFSAASFSEPLDINSASAEQLAQVMVGVGKTKADAIVQERDKNGKFQSVDDLSRVKGIKQNLIEKNRDKLVVGSGAAMPAAEIVSK